MTKRLTKKEEAAVIVLETINQLNDAELKRFKRYFNSEIRELKLAVKGLVDRAWRAVSFENDFIIEADNLKQVAADLSCKVAKLEKLLEEAHGRAREADQAET